MSTATVPRVIRPITHLDLPDRDDAPVENTFQPPQSQLLTDSLLPFLQKRRPELDFMFGEDTGIYFQQTANPMDGCRVPDWFVVLGVPLWPDDATYRRSYVMWQEREVPYLLLEYVSDESRGTEYDKTVPTGKFYIYERRIRAPFYAIYEPDSARLEVFQHRALRYRRAKPDSDGRFDLPDLGVKLGVWEGEHRLAKKHWLRWFDRVTGEMLPSPVEDASANRTDSLRERQRSEQAEAARLAAESQFASERLARLAAEAKSQAAEAKSQSAESEAARLRDKLRQLGVEP